VNQSLNRLNELSAEDAEAELLKCCGSTVWARQMCASRPFSDYEGMTAKAGEIWRALSKEDWLEAFRAHPKIGEKKAATVQSAEAQRWSAQEQSESEQAADDLKAALADANRRYEAQFGYIFIICASGKSAPEILESLHNRLHNDPKAELRNAAEEQRKITELRLKKLLES
jgi:OHCU decarboxylase